MQIQKEHTREQILQAAEQAFHQQGFAKTSMRDIARLSGVGVGNLYNYFPKGKDEIFRLIVSPLIQDMERMVYEHHDERHAERYLDYLSNGNPELLEYQMREYLSDAPPSSPDGTAFLSGARLVVGELHGRVYRPLHGTSGTLHETGSRTAPRHNAYMQSVHLSPAHGVDVHHVLRNYQAPAAPTGGGTGGAGLYHL